MESNEDNRQMTALQELKEKIKLLKMIRVTDSDEDDTLVYYEAAEVESLIESLLPKEHAIMRQCYASGVISGDSRHASKSEAFIRKTFKQG